MAELVQYEHMRVAVQKCAQIDEAKDIRDKDAALAAYARERDDIDLEVWTREIKARAAIRIGELSQDLEKKGDVGRPPKNMSHERDQLHGKRDALKDAGLSKSTANRYEELAGGKDQRGRAAAQSAADLHFARARQEQKPVTMEGLRGAIKGAVEAALGPPPVVRRVPPPPPPAPVNLDLTAFGAAIRQISELSDRVNAYHLAAAVNQVIAQTYFDQARRTVGLVSEFIQMLERRFPDEEATQAPDARTG